MDYLKPKENLYGFELPNSDPMRVAQASYALGSSNQHIKNLACAGELVDVDVGPSGHVHSWRITRQSLVDFIERRTTGPITEVDFQAEIVPHGLSLPDVHLLRARQVSEFLQCSIMHVINLIDAWELVGTNIGLSEQCNATYRIPRAALIHFVNSRIEGAY